MEIGIIGGGINGLCTALKLSENGHNVTLYERGKIMSETSMASSKLLHGGLRYLENFEFRLVKEALIERDNWIKRAPHLAKPLRLTLPIYKKSRRSRFTIGSGLFLYDHLAGKSILAKSNYLKKDQLISKDPILNADGLVGGFEYSDGQMDDFALGCWIAEQAKDAAVIIKENTEVNSVKNDATLNISGKSIKYDFLINIAGPWSESLLVKSGIQSPYKLDLVRGSHLIINQFCNTAYLLEIPNERRIFFVLPWKETTLIGTTEIRQSLEEPILCDISEEKYLLNAYSHYFPNVNIQVLDKFAGLRPLIRSNENPNKATREYELFQNEKLLTVFGGKWTTSMALAKKIAERIY